MSAGLNRRLDRLEAAIPGRRVNFVVVDHWPDGGTRAFLDNGEELPPGADWRSLVIEGAGCTVIGGVNLDMLLGRKPGLTREQLNRAADEDL